MDSVLEWRPYFVGDSGLICCDTEDERSWNTSLGLFGGGAGSGGGFLATSHTSTTFLGLAREVGGLPIIKGRLPGSAESHKGTKLLFDEDRLRLILSTALSNGPNMCKKVVQKSLVVGWLACNCKVVCTKLVFVYKPPKAGIPASRDTHARA
jgi:hypothetical protein